MLFETLATTGHEQVVFCHNHDAGLKAIIAIHNTTLGPAWACAHAPLRQHRRGAGRRAPLHLSRTMTYKNALAGLNLSVAARAVIIGDPVDKTEVLFRAFGRYVDSLGGRAITAEDVGTDVNDMENIYLESQFVTGVHQVHGGSGDPAQHTTATVHCRR
jgi:leucine dehydrogenase